ncbi:hypothetical protein ACNOYE_15770 [Nannocystaceae bacterium ST9]
MATITSVFQDALAEQAKAALSEVVTRQPKTTVAELAELIASNPTLGSITLNELLKGVGGGAAPVAKRRGRPPGRKNAPAAVAAAPAGAAPAAAAAAPAAKRKAAGPGKRNVRTETGREQFDEEVLATLRLVGGDTVAATTLREHIGADPTQLRTSLNRLIERGLVTFTGKARGTRYSLA